MNLINKDSNQVTPMVTLSPSVVSGKGGNGLSQQPEPELEQLRGSSANLNSPKPKINSYNYNANKTDRTTASNSNTTKAQSKSKSKRVGQQPAKTKPDKQSRVSAGTQIQPQIVSYLSHLMNDFSRELGDMEHAASNCTQVLNIYRSSLKLPLMLDASENKSAGAGSVSPSKNDKIKASTASEPSPAQANQLDITPIARQIKVKVQVKIDPLTDQFVEVLYEAKKKTQWVGNVSNKAAYFFMVVRDLLGLSVTRKVLDLSLAERGAMAMAMAAEVAAVHYSARASGVNAKSADRVAGSGTTFVERHQPEPEPEQRQRRSESETASSNHGQRQTQNQRYAYPNPPKVEFKQSWLTMASVVSR